MSSAGREPALQRVDRLKNFFRAVIADGICFGFKRRYRKESTRKYGHV